MLKISKSAEYSILALIYISNNENKSVVNSRTISEQLNIPYDLLSKLLQKLVKQKIIKSQQGKYGGYRMLVPADKLTMLNIINALNENIQLANCTIEDATANDCVRLDNCIIRSPFQALQNRINNMFESITLNELIN